MNDNEIFPLPVGEKVVIPVHENNPKIIVTDGYHFTKPLELVYHHIHTYYFRVVCIIDDFQLAAGLFIIFLFYLLGFTTGFFILKLAAFFPIVYFPFFYYINRNDFIQIRAT